MIWKNDPLKKQIINLAKQGGFREKIIITEENPTVEYLARFLYNTIKKLLPSKNNYKLKIVVQMTKTIKAEYYE
jgi:6-pyruvoyl-tetrahydropterin synthase